jgi:hypothetical protein
MPDAPPIGQRFSHVYIKRGEPTQDSPRMRRRLAALIRTFSDLGDFGSVVPREIGINVPFRGFYDWEAFFRDCASQDALDITSSQSRVDTLRRQPDLAALLASTRQVVGAVKCSEYSKKRMCTIVSTNGEVFISVSTRSLRTIGRRRSPLFRALDTVPP